MTKVNAPAILVTNDDGIDAEGLDILRVALAGLGEITVVAPREPRSASSHAISLYRPVRYERVKADSYAVDGTPVDSVVLAVNHILPKKPDLVVSGINLGANLGQNVFYSGTVAAAVEGTFHGIPSVAISLCSGGDSAFGPAADFMKKLAAVILEHGLPSGITLNVNVPHGQSHQGVRLTRRAHRLSRRLVVEEESHPKDGLGYWIKERVQPEQFTEDSDHAAVRKGLISVTPLSFEWSDAPMLGALEQWIQSFQPQHAR